MRAWSHVPFVSMWSGPGSQLNKLIMLWQAGISKVVPFSMVDWVIQKLFQLLVEIQDRSDEVGRIEQLMR